MTEPAAAAVRQTKRGKYGNRRVEYDGRKFDSQAEATRYLILKSRQAMGDISRLECQPRFDLTVEGVIVCRYVADFRYLDVKTGEMVVEDVKGVKTPVYQIKKKLMRAIHRIVIHEVTVR